MSEDARGGDPAERDAPTRAPDPGEPQRGAPNESGGSPGWFRDPTARYEHRYWDGRRWTDRVARSGSASVDPRGVEPDPPVPLPTGSWAPPPPPTARRPAWPWALAAGLVAFAIGVGGCVAVSAIVANRVTDEVKERRERHAITVSQYDAIELGMTRDQVIEQLGKQPRGTSELLTEGVFGQDRLGPDCIVYLEEGDLLFPSFRFCFDEAGILTSKAST